MSDGRRQARESERIRAAATAARAASGSAMDTALAQIGAAFDGSAAVFDFKMRIERLLCRGPQHPAVQARFRARALLLRGLNLNAAIARTERWWCDERKAFQIASALGYGNRLSLQTLRELRLILRFMRFKRMQIEFASIIAAVWDDTLPLAAE